MASVLPGYEYDIFISYRQKDNKYDGWVTEFVSNLRKELEATFKQNIFLYFDESGSDTILANHSVEKSINNKLKCLIFIPVLSQTYCDPTSYAWKYEFCAFNHWVKSDTIGRHRTLSAGNVVSRILPIKIHEIEIADRNLLENELGEPLRSIEFIYSEPGVNRPLKPADPRRDNQSGTDYRNQINKVANAIKELLTAITSPTGAMPPAPSTKLSRTRNTIAVLPFENMSSDPEQEYFSDGVTEDIITQLSKIQGIRVISRTSVMPYKRSGKALTEIARELNVSHLLEGSVRKAGQRIRVVAQLILADSDGHLWAETFDRELVDIFTVQSEIAGKVAEALRSKLTTPELQEIRRKPTTSIEAYNNYLLGLSHYHNLGPDSFNQAVVYFNKAISIDDKFALAKAAVARTLAYHGAGYWGIRPNDVKVQALQLVEEAIKLEPTLALAYEVRAAILEYYYYQWENAGNDVRRAIALDPNLGFAHLTNSFHLMIHGRVEEGLAEGEECLSLDPLSINFRTNCTFLWIFAGRGEEALRAALATVDLNPGIPIAWAVLGYVYAHLGLSDQSVSAAAKAVSLTNRSDYLTILFHAYALARAGRRDEARTILADVESRQTTEFVWPLGIALAYTHLDEKDKALDYLEKSYEERVGYLWAISRDPTFKPLKDEPRFKLLLEKIGPSLMC